MKHFDPKEFACKCGKCGKGFTDMDELFLTRLDSARECAGVPFRIVSAMRCPEHNKAEGGKPKSAHLTGHAVDIMAVDSIIRMEIVNAALRVGIRRIGIANTFIHLDDDPALPQGVIWLY